MLTGIIAVLLLVSALSLSAADGYRGQLWGSNKESVRKGSGELYSGRVQDLVDALVYTSTFQGYDALYKYMFRDDSLVMVAITADLPWALNIRESFKRNFDLSERAVQDLITGLERKYGSADLAENTGTDTYMLWRSGDTEIELIIKRDVNYRLILSYSWESYFRRLDNSRKQKAMDEL